jgi:redox-sensitive bicupin YhaK (pirin superfamily)
MAPIQVVRASERFHTQLSWLESWHSFSFGEHYDPNNTHHGLLLVLNDDVVAPGGGFGLHPHRDMEIVTWVLAGALEHRDSEGNHGLITPGLAQRMSAGTGIRHSEVNASRSEPVHLLQMWVPPDTNGIEPGYEEADLSARIDEGGLVPVASGQGHEGALTIHQRDAALYVARMQPGDTVIVPDAPHAHVYVAYGDVALDGHQLTAGDAARLTAAGSPSLHAESASEVAIWATA